MNLCLGARYAHFSATKKTNAYTLLQTTKTHIYNINIGGMFVPPICDRPSHFAKCTLQFLKKNAKKLKNICTYQKKAVLLHQI